MVKRIFNFILAIPPRLLLAVACGFTAVGLLFMVAPIFVKIPLFLVASISVSHVAGIVGVVLFGASVLQEVLQKNERERVLESERNRETDPLA